jgi:hypothetical protein
MFKLAIVAAILPAAAWWWTTHFAQAAISEPGVYAFYHPGDLPSASCLAKSAAYLVSRSNDTPAESLFDAIEAELERRSVEP